MNFTGVRSPSIKADHGGSAAKLLEREREYVTQITIYMRMMLFKTDVRYLMSNVDTCCISKM